MTELEVNFAKLNEQIIVYFHSNNEAQLVQESKELFSEWIDSKRALERISTVKELLKLLKRRGIFSPNEEAFKLFKKIIHDDEKFNALVDKHKRLQRGCSHQYKNVYAARRNQTSQTQRNADIPQYTNGTQKPPSQFPIPADKRNDIFKIISNGLSSSEFLSASRYLDFNDNELKDITDRYRDTRTRVMVMLNQYEIRKNSLKKLLHVLNLIGRPDIVRQIDHL